MNSELNQETNSTRKPLLAFLFALFFPGLGQVYNGQIKKGMLFFLIEFTLPVVFGIIRLGITFVGFVSILVIGFAYRIYVIYDATKTAGKLKTFTLKRYNTWYYYLAMVVGISTIIWFYDANLVMGVKAYHIPTTSSEPTIKIGDQLITDLRAYDKKLPNYGDLVVFQKEDSLSYCMYRVVALPNDKVEIQHNFLILNGKKCKTTFVKENRSQEFAVNEYEEVFPNGHKNNIFTFKKPFDGIKTDVEAFVVPANCYFLMGDNRDNAMDSRYIGFVRKEEIIGKIIFGYWGKTRDRINLDLRDK